MVDVTSLYTSEHFWDYTPMVEAFGSVLVRVDDDDYSGCTYVLYEEGGRFGYLVFGWGSCSGCDALQGCNSFEEVQELADQLERSIEWFNSAEELIATFEARDWALRWEGHSTTFAVFLEKVYARLGK